MTPLELLDSVKAEFQVVYLSPVSLTNALTKTLGACQEKSGPVKSVTFPLDGTVIDRPADFLSVAVALDARGVWHEVALTTDAEDSPTITALETAATVRPVTLTYFLNLRKQAEAESYELPEDCLSLLYDHLYATMDVVNSRRAREVSVATGMQVEIPADEELRQRVESIEQKMEEARAIIPTALVF